MKKAIIPIIILFYLPLATSAADYYWVGGSGDWSDISHWATVSGGTVKHSQAPGPEDDVYFDGNSFSAPNQVVTLNNGVNFCRDFIWTGVTNTPRFQASSFVSLSIYGSAELSMNMLFQMDGRLILAGSGTSKNIDFQTHSAGPDLQVVGEGEWILQSDLTVDSMFTILEGEIDFNGKNIETEHLYIIGSRPKSLDLDNTVLTISGAFLKEEFMSDEEAIKSAIFNVNNLQVTSDNAEIIFSAKDPAWWFQGEGSVSLGKVSFTSTSGKAILRNFEDDPEITISDLDLMSSALIIVDLNIGNLTLNGGSVYEFESGRTYDIEILVAEGDCSSGVIITSTDNGNRTTFSKQSGSFSLSFVTLRDIRITGGGANMVNNGVDLGNNDGWTFMNSDPVSYYWIGGTGNWTDPIHWSLTSGGTSSGCVPTGKDNVFFDVNSFNAANQVVSIDIENVYVRDMTWMGVQFEPEFAGDEDSKVRVTGSLDMQAEVNHTFEGDYFFESKSTNTIAMNGNIFHQDIVFNGTDAIWNFSSDIEVTRNLQFTSGSLNFNQYDLVTTGFLSESVLPRNLDIRGSYILLKIHDYYNPYWTAYLDNFDVNSKSSTIEFTGNWYGSFSHYSQSVNQGFALYNKVIFSSYTGALNTYNWDLGIDQPGIEIDSVVYLSRGFLGGSTRINYLELASGSDYEFDSGDYQPVQVVAELVSSGSCESGTTSLYGSDPGRGALITLQDDFTFERLDLKNIHFQGGSVTANNSIDGGGNLNVTFDELVGRTLYWVDNGGAWEETEHWSLTSGGPGGECIPTAIDNVIFDENSFSQDFQGVESNQNWYRKCHDITWTNTSNDPQFYGNFLVVNGSLEYDDTFNNQVWRTIFTGTDEETLRSGSQNFITIEVRNDDTLRLLDNIKVSEFNVFGGGFSAEDINMETFSFYISYSGPKFMKLNDSRIEVTGTTDNYDYPPFRDYSWNTSVRIDPGTSTIVLSGQQTGIYSENNLEFNNIEFTNATGHAAIAMKGYNRDEVTNNIIKANKIHFFGNGEIVGAIETDTLIGSPGKSYELEPNHTNIVQAYLQLIGNNCTPIELKSRIQGVKTSLEMPSSGKVRANFLQLQDNIASGGADFNAGSRSTDIGNSNVGWTFEDAPELNEAGFLGPDRVLCSGENEILSAYSFSPQESYLWSDGSVDSILDISTPGTYFVAVEFLSNCVLRDSVDIFTQTEIVPNLAPNLSACEGEVIELDPELDIPTAFYEWSTGSDAPTILVSDPGIYSLSVTVDDCVTTAESILTVTGNPGLNLGEDRSICEGEEFTLDAGVTLDNYLWQDGSMNPLFTTSQVGTFTLETSTEGCVFRDTITITSVDRPVVDLGGDVSICSNESASLSYDNSLNHTLLWNDGSTGEEILITDAGQYKLTVDDDGCASADSVIVTIINAPQVDLGDDLYACSGEEVTVSAPAGISNFIWSDGNEEGDLIVAESGDYFIDVEENGCSASDTINIFFKPIPRINLGRDTIVCDDRPYEITAISQNGMIIWDNGATENTIAVTNSGQYKVTIIEDGCSSSDSIRIDFKSCIEFQAYIPNAFSPNDDGINDRLEIYFADGLVINQFDLKIFDRWGNRVFETNDHTNYWDGKLNNIDLEPGTFIYIIDIDYIDDFGSDTTQIIGDVNILE